MRPLLVDLRIQHSQMQYISQVLSLVARGYRVTIEPAGSASYHAIVYGPDGPVGDLSYRCPSEEKDPNAMGISYASYLTDPALHYDPVFEHLCAWIGGPSCR
jgi:hypothetical protein